MNNNNTNNEFQLLEIESQNMNTSLEMFEIVKEAAEEYCQYVKKYKEYTSLYYEKISKLSLNKKEIKNKNIKISPIFSILKKIPHLIEQQVKGLKIFIDSFDLSLKQLENVLKNELNSLDEPKKSFEESKKQYKNNKIKNKKLMDSLSSLEKKIVKYQLSKKENQKGKENNRDMTIINTNINEAQNLEKDFLNNNKECENFHKKFQDESLNNIDIIKLRIRSIVENLNNIVIFFLSFFNQCYSPSVTYIQNEIEKNTKNPIDITNLVNDNLKIKLFKLEEIPSDKYNIKILEHSDIDDLSYSFDELNNEDDTLKKFKTFSFFSFKKTKNKDDEDDLSKLNKIDILEIVEKFYDNFKMVNKDKYDINIEKEKIEIKNLTDKILLMKKYKNKNDEKEEKLTDEEKEKLFSLVTKKENRVVFLRRFNKIRTYGNFEYNKNTFDDIIKIFLKILDEIYNEKDVFSFQFCIILSQTFFIFENGKKKYLYKYIKSHKVYQCEEIWKNSIDYFIEKEIKKFNEMKKNLSIKNSESKNNEMIFAQLIPMANNMIEFEVDKNIRDKLMTESMKKYKVNETSKNIILNLLNDSSNNNNNEKENIIKGKKEINNENDNIADNKNKIENDNKNEIHNKIDNSDNKIDNNDKIGNDNKTEKDNKIENFNNNTNENDIKIENDNKIENKNEINNENNNEIKEKNIIKEEENNNKKEN